MNKEKQVVELCCKVGDKVYEVYCNRMFEYVVTSIEILSSYEIVYKIRSTYPYNRFIRIIGFGEHQVGKTIFLTKDEAERALKNRKM